MFGTPIDDVTEEDATWSPLNDVVTDDVIDGWSLGEGGSEGDEKLKEKRREETQDNKKGDRDNGEQVDVDKTKRHMSDTDGTVKKKSL